MLKKVITVWIIITLFFTIILALTSCSQEKNPHEEKTIKNEEIAKEVSIVNQTAQKKANAVQNSAIPNFAELYSNTVEIDVNFDPNGMFRTCKVEIQDKAILSDILTMIGQSQLIKDESKIKKMSGMATNNSLLLVTEDGSKKEIQFAFDDPALAVGYIGIDGNKYDP